MSNETTVLKIQHFGCTIMAVASGAVNIQKLDYLSDKKGSAQQSKPFLIRGTQRQVVGWSDLRYGSIASVWPPASHFRSTPNNGHHPVGRLGPFCATKRLMHRSKQCRYSITSSARASSDGGTVSPSSLAVLRLITNSCLVGACTGMSAGFSPFRMRST